MKKWFFAAAMLMVILITSTVTTVMARDTDEWYPWNMVVFDENGKGTAYYSPGTARIPAIYKDVDIAVEAKNKDIWITFDEGKTIVTGKRVGDWLFFNFNFQEIGQKYGYAKVLRYIDPKTRKVGLGLPVIICEPPFVPQGGNASSTNQNIQH